MNSACGCVEYSGCVPPVNNMLLSSSQMLVALGQLQLLFVYVILPELCYYVGTVVQHSYLIYSCFNL